MDPLVFDLHIHSRHSHDSLLSPERILKRAKRAGIEGIAITDHQTIRGAVEARELSWKYNITVIVGSEISTDRGDLIGLNLVEEVGATHWEDAIGEIRGQGGTVLLPHPYRNHTGVDEMAGRVDLIEIWNSRCTADENRRATDLALAQGKPGVLGSDAHTALEIGNVKALMDPGTWKVYEVHARKPADPWRVRWSQAVHHMKKGELGILMEKAADILWKGKR